ncbi:type II secretion system inner membrane protein GspF [uncultured Hyphomonas sp.]|jgi:general secretion pathway protein F|uniref:type II secretion system inner membrane protein GspF n=1 Tax=uncultured Hyphomonas sp. TaxID=225298 RepID=UPI0030DC32A5|tara:strand:+ start:141765 stop:142973 length:1209 start_codon:yes stop_codon:yes gene_type:complete
MPAFEYVAVDDHGRRQKGIISAESPRSARRELRLRDLMALDVIPVSEQSARTSRIGARIGEKQRVLLVRQLSVLLQSGLPVEQALAAAAEDAATPQTQRVLHAIKTEVTEGARLADAMAVAPKAFPPLVRSVVSAGELSGRLGDVMERLATYLERSHQLRQKVQAALIYPAVLGIMAVGMIIAMMLFVVPRLVEQFDLFDADLPLITRIVISLSETLQSHGILIALALATLVFAMVRAFRVPAVRRAIDRYSLNLPIVGPLNRTVCAGRFARVFATLSGSGATILEALSGAKGASGNLVFSEAAEQIAERVREGGSFAGALKATGVFPPMMVHMVSSGEAGRDIPGMMTRAADFLDNEFETGSSTLLSLLEPLIIVVLGGLVGLIVLSVMLPILQLNTLAIG